MMESAGSFVTLLTWGALLASVAISVAIGVILAFHWFRYAMNTMGASMALAIYAVVTAILLMTIAAATFTFLSL